MNSVLHLNSFGYHPHEQHQHYSSLHDLSSPAFHQANPLNTLFNDAEQYPTYDEFQSIVQEYLDNLSPKKRDKALVDERRYEMILQVLRDPRNTSISTAQFRFWVKKMFQLGTDASFREIVKHDNKPVATREDIYDILVRAHREAHHGGRDKTSALVRRRYSWIPKELIARFVRNCPFCISRRNSSQSPSIDTPKTPSPIHPYSLAHITSSNHSTPYIGYNNMQELDFKSPSHLFRPGYDIPSSPGTPYRGYSPDMSSQQDDYSASEYGEDQTPTNLSFPHNIIYPHYSTPTRSEFAGSPFAVMDIEQQNQQLQNALGTQNHQFSNFATQYGFHRGQIPDILGITGLNLPIAMQIYPQEDQNMIAAQQAAAQQSLQMVNQHSSQPNTPFQSPANYVFRSRSESPKGEENEGRMSGFENPNTLQSNTKFREGLTTGF